MIRFITLFLGLVHGPLPIELSVTEGVAAVELLLDGAAVARLEGEPWSVELDLGERLLPHHLAAVAYDEEGREVGRASQHLNLPRRPVEATVLLRGDPEGRERTLHVSWESRSGARPAAVRAEFDGAPLAVEDLSVILLPAHDPQALHFLRVEVEFDDGTTSTAEMAFGGVHLDTVSSQLTAVPVALEGRRKLPPPEELTGWLAVDGNAPRVLSAETGAAHLLVVRSRLSVGDLRWAQKQELTKALPDAHWRRSRLFGAQPWQLRMVWPVARGETGNLTPFDLFPYSEPEADESGTLLRWVIETDPPDQLRGHERLADAVAVAGVAAAAENERRAVVVILGQDEVDESVLRPGEVRGYLEALQVPLFVWSTRPEGASVRDWGEVEDVSSAAGLTRSVDRVLEALDRQRVIWLAGDHLPQSVRLTSAARGVRLAD